MGELTYLDESGNKVHVDINLFDKRTVIRNVDIEIFENTATGKVSIGWYETENTIYEKEEEE